MTTAFSVQDDISAVHVAVDNGFTKQVKGAFSHLHLVLQAVDLEFTYVAQMNSDVLGPDPEPARIDRGAPRLAPGSIPAHALKHERRRARRSPDAI